MSLRDWLRTVDDDTLVAWANRGLLRRGQKLLETQVPGGWKLEAERASAEIDGHRQTVDGVGFAHLACTCPAMGPCHHLLCFLLGLRQRLATEASDARPDNAAVPATTATPVPGPQASATSTAGAAAPATPAADSPAAEPWLILDPDVRLAALGRPALTRAQRWLAQGLSAEVEIAADKLVATLDAPEDARLTIPRTGGLAASVCSCRESRCAHRALVVLQLARDANPDDAAATLGTVEALGEYRLATLTALDGWLAELATLGMNGASALLVARGEALATELVQADLPHPGRMLSRLARALDDERRAMAGSSVARVRRQLAELLAHRRALARSPLPQPLPLLAGVHRRSFSPRSNLALICVAAECWETTSGFHGFSLHFLSSSDGRAYSLSEARALALNPTWHPAKALAAATFAGHRVTALPGMACLLEKGWVSEDGRLASREGTRLRIEGPVGVDTLRMLAESPTDRLYRVAEHRITWLYRPDPHPWGVTAAQITALPAFDRFAQRWMGKATSDEGEPFSIVLPGSAAGTRAAELLQRTGTTCVWLFGRWSVEQNRAVLAPIAIGSPKGNLVQLFTEI
ncbi:hypothetical protein [Pseudomonas indica]|uniref:hypothetical protein n=1 Tax=Pseudomonas indica TaxID=137658 RepID=UPI000BABFAE7|nr:hypothetical protein [Pseudomonas indica]PAU51817.1 hypothetical protein BZL42_25055 [Pseudomonas indica]